MCPNNPEELAQSANKLYFSQNSYLPNVVKDIDTFTIQFTNTFCPTHKSEVKQLPFPVPLEDNSERKAA